MPESGFSLTRIFAYNDKIYREIRVKENPYSSILYEALLKEETVSRITTFPVKGGVKQYDNKYNAMEQCN